MSQVECKKSSMPKFQWQFSWTATGVLIGTDNGLSLERRQAIIWTNAGMLLNTCLGTNLSEILIGNQTFSFKKMHLKMSSAKWRPFCLGFNVLTHCALVMPYGRVSFHFLTQIKFILSYLKGVQWHGLEAIAKEVPRSFNPYSLTHWPLGDLTTISN